MHSVLIRPLKIEDAETSWKWRNNQDIWKFTGSKPNKIVTAEIEKEWITKVLSSEDSKRFAILADFQYIGNVQLTNIIHRKEAQLHIFIGETNFWGKGIAQLAINQLLKYAKDVLKLKSIYLLVNPNNTAAIRVYEKLGFIKESDEIKMFCDIENFASSKVSVFMMVYNHENYLESAIEGLLIQQCNFYFDIVIGEDCSTDKSREIIKKYAELYPGKFTLLLHDRNIGALKNQVLTLEACTGEYIAVCEGDDYWVNPLKLHKQVDFLEKNKDYTICWTKYKILQSQNESTYLLKDHLSNPKWLHLIENKQAMDVSLDNIYSPYATYTLTVLFRKCVVDISLLRKMKYAKDNTIYCMCLEKGKGAILNFFGGVYRMHLGGTYSSINVFNQAYSNFLNLNEIIRMIPSCDNFYLRKVRNEFLLHAYYLSLGDKAILGRIRKMFSLYISVVSHVPIKSKLKVSGSLIKRIILASIKSSISFVFPSSLNPPTH